MTDEQRVTLLELLLDLRGETTGVPAAREAVEALRTVAQPQQIPLELRIGRRPGDGVVRNGRAKKGAKQQEAPFRRTLHELLTAQVVVSLLTGPKPFRRNKVLFFGQNNMRAARIQGLVRAILESQYPDVAEEVYDAHVYRSMSMGHDASGKHQGVHTVGAEDVERRLTRFRTAARGVLYNSNVSCARRAPRLPPSPFQLHTPPSHTPSPRPAHHHPPQFVSEGFNCPDVDAVVIDYPVTTPQRIIQIIGRCRRVDAENPDKTAMVVLPVHDPEAIVEREWGPERKQLAAGALAPFADDGVELPFTPWQRSFDVIRKVRGAGWERRPRPQLHSLSLTPACPPRLPSPQYMECLMDPAIRVITRAFTLAVGIARGSAYGDRGPVKDVAPERMQELLVGGTTRRGLAACRGRMHAA